MSAGQSGNPSDTRLEKRAAGVERDLVETIAEIDQRAERAKEETTTAVLVHPSLDLARGAAEKGAARSLRHPLDAHEQAAGRH